MSAGRVARRIRGVAGRARAHRLRRGAVVDRSLRDAALDERHAPLRRPLHVEGDRERARIERVLDEHERLAGHLLADAAGHERTALLDRLAAEPRQGDDPQDLGDGKLLEDRLVVAWGELAAVPIKSALLDGPRRDPRGIELARTPREVLGISRADVALHERAQVGQRAARIERDPAW